MILRVMFCRILKFFKTIYRRVIFEGIYLKCRYPIYMHNRHVIQMATYYDEPSKLHWNPNVERLGFGTLLKKVNHVAIIVSDVNRSLTFYVQVLGLQQIRRPNFDRFGAWLTMGNIELHLIKGVPVVPGGDNLIVPHISMESDDIDGVLAKLTEMNIPFSRNVSVPDASESKPITQYFIRDPDGYYIELCNCNILTDFCLEKNNKTINYDENVKNVEISHIFKLAILAQKALTITDENLETLIPDECKWAEVADPVKLKNMLSRCVIYGDIMQGETEQSICTALKMANNNVPLATKIIKALKKGHEIYIPPAFYEQGKERYQPTVYVAPKVKQQATEQATVSCSTKDSYERIARKMFEHFDKDKNGFLTKDEILAVLRSLRQNMDENYFADIWSRQDSNNDGVIDVEEFLSIIKNNRLTM